MLSAVLLGSILSCLKKEKRESLELWKHISAADTNIKNKYNEEAVHQIY